MGASPVLVGKEVGKTNPTRKKAKGPGGASSGAFHSAVLVKIA